MGLCYPVQCRAGAVVATFNKDTTKLHLEEIPTSRAGLADQISAILDLDVFRERIDSLDYRAKADMLALLASFL